MTGLSLRRMRAMVTARVMPIAIAATVRMSVQPMARKMIGEKRVFPTMSQWKFLLVIRPWTPMAARTAMTPAAIHRPTCGTGIAWMRSTWVSFCSPSRFARRSGDVPSFADGASAGGVDSWGVWISDIIISPG